MAIERTRRGELARGDIFKELLFLVSFHVQRIVVFGVISCSKNCCFWCHFMFKELLFFIAWVKNIPWNVPCSQKRSRYVPGTKRLFSLHYRMEQYMESFFCMERVMERSMV